jgi:cellulose synthase/poly-beta-1,6-N-acetylglucosamine synthase-like glycosyltransferase
VTVTFATLSVVALVFGVVWLYVNAYTFVPVYRKAFLALVGGSEDPRVYEEGTAVPDEELPTVDVLLPAYDEDETVGYSIRSLREADYPDGKLRISVLVEAFDRETRDELSRLRRLYDFDEVVVPPSYPGDANKPRALNYGFEVTDGEIVGVIDAEDIVAPELFRQAVCALLDGGHDYAQGRLDMSNEDDGVLNTLFRGEYGFWYGTVIPSYFRVGNPVPLGGTTNFAWRSVLKEASEERVERFGSPWSDDEPADTGHECVVPWDPRNVTEDFELGFLLWEMGKSMAMVKAVTREESPVGLNGWVRQRTRWQKGKLYTLVQRMRHPPSGATAKAHIYTQSATPHLGPINIVGVVLIAVYANIVGFLASPVVAAVLVAGLVMVLHHMALQAYGYLSITEETGFRRVRRTAYNFVGLPLYWGIIWGSDVRAFIQLASDSLRWEKTRHVGRHTTREDPTGVEPTMEAVGLRLVVYSVGCADAVSKPDTGSGWTWRLDSPADELTVASAGRLFGTEDGARRHAAAFNDALPVAVGSGTVFGVDGTDGGGWGWRLRDGASELAVGPPELHDEKEARDCVGRVRSVAGTAAVDEVGLGDGKGDTNGTQGGTAEDIFVSVEVEKKDREE